MNTYFAKLAARATVSSGLALVAADSKTIVDPFEQTASFANHSAEVSSEKTTPLLYEQADVRTPHSPLPSPVPHRQESSTLIRPGEAKDISGKSPLPQSDSERVSAITMRPTEAISGPSIDRARELESEKATRPEQRATSPAQAWPAPLLTPMLVGELSSAIRAEGGNSGNESEQVRHEESMLLHKADDFMRKLYENRDSEVEQPPVPKSNSQAAEITRLHPRQPDERIHERDADRPSLVIGRLTVEVTSAPPALVAPRQQVVVVRGTRGDRSGISSSRRFGLSQF